jgi:hypothetical protein
LIEFPKLGIETYTTAHGRGKVTTKIVPLGQITAEELLIFLFRKLGTKKLEKLYNGS